MRPVILTVGKPGSTFGDAALAEYGKRLRRWDGLDQDWVKAERFRGDAAAVKQAEGARVLARVRDRDQLIALDERGEAIGTEAFVELVQAARMSGVQRLIFAIGGAYGHDPAVRKRAHRVVRLSTMVLNHEVARVVLIEQIYRAYAVIQGVPYHH